MPDDAEISRLLREYTQIIEKLKALGAIRTTKVVSDYGEYVACKRLNLTFVGNSGNKGYDSIDSAGKKYEIKTRKENAWNKPNVFPTSDVQLRTADYLVYVEFDNDWNLLKLLKIPMNEVKANSSHRVPITKALVEKYSLLKQIQ